MLLIGMYVHYNNDMDLIYIHDKCRGGLIMTYQSPIPDLETYFNEKTILYSLFHSCFFYS